MTNKPDRSWDFAALGVIALLVALGLSRRYPATAFMISWHPIAGLLLTPLLAFKEIVFINRAKTTAPDAKTNARKMALILIASVFSSGIACAVGFGSVSFHQSTVVLTVLLEVWLAITKGSSAVDA